MKVNVIDLANKQVGEMELSEAVFGQPVRKDMIHAMINYQLNKRRSGNHKTKGISEISGTGKKPWRQKGTGRARAGSLRRPQDVGGATIFGPVVRSHATNMPKKARLFALKSALSSKAAEGKLVVLDKAEAKSHKTKPMAEAFGKLGWANTIIVGGETLDVNFARATSNLPRVDVLPIDGLNVYDIMRRDVLVLTREAVESIEKRLAS